jgi:hypothetical protein
MRTWLIEEPGGERGEIYQVREVTDAEILEDRWEWWKEIMEKKYGPGSSLITEENCIQDWVVDNYATEYKDGTYSFHKNRHNGILHKNLTEYQLNELMKENEV